MPADGMAAQHAVATRTANQTKEGLAGTLPDSSGHRLLSFTTYKGGRGGRPPPNGYTAGVSIDLMPESLREFSDSCCGEKVRQWSPSAHTL